MESVATSLVTSAIALPGRQSPTPDDADAYTPPESDILMLKCTMW